MMSLAISASSGLTCKSVISQAGHVHSIMCGNGMLRHVSCIIPTGETLSQGDVTCPPLLLLEPEWRVACAIPDPMATCFAELILSMGWKLSFKEPCTTWVYAGDSKAGPPTHGDFLPCVRAIEQLKLPAWPSNPQSDSTASTISNAQPEHTRMEACTTPPTGGSRSAARRERSSASGTELPEGYYFDMLRPLEPIDT